jgi:heat shock protein HslJ
MPTKLVLMKIAPLLAISLLALSACAGPTSGVGPVEPPIDRGPGLGEETPGDPIPIEGIDGDWIFLDGIDASGAMTVDTTVTLMISGDSLIGQSSCNNYSASLDGEPTELTVKDLAHTERACIDDALTEFESRYFAALDRVTVAIPTGGSLVLQGDGVTMNFLPKQSLPEN